ncbi:MAG: hypothetical protein WDN69_36310 [Aliidongia sp.]
MIWFGAASVGGIVVALCIVWAFNGFHGLGLDTAGTVALILGVTLTSALGVVLMGLIFYSDRSSADEAAYHATVEHTEAPAGRFPPIQDDGLDAPP